MVILLIIFILISLSLAIVGRKRKGVSVTFLLLALLAGIMLIKQVFSSTYVETANKVWGLDLPKPNKEIVVVVNAGGFPMNGDIFTIAEYKDEENDSLKKAIDWQPYSEEMSLKIDMFFDLLNSSLEDQGKLTDAIFNKISHNRPVLSDEMLYYTYTKPGSSFVILIFSPQEKRMYMLQTIM